MLAQDLWAAHTNSAYDKATESTLKNKLKTWAGPQQNLAQMGFVHIPPVGFLPIPQLWDQVESEGATERMRREYGYEYEFEFADHERADTVRVTEAQGAFLDELAEERGQETQDASPDYAAVSSRTVAS